MMDMEIRATEWAYNTKRITKEQYERNMKRILEKGESVEEYFNAQGR